MQRGMANEEQRTPTWPRGHVVKVGLGVRIDLEGRRGAVVNPRSGATFHN